MKTTLADEGETLGFILVHGTFFHTDASLFFFYSQLFKFLFYLFELWGYGDGFLNSWGELRFSFSHF